MPLESQVLAEIESCNYLFLREINELDYNGLRVVIEEGIAQPELVSTDVGGTQFSGLPVISTDKSRRFEIVWALYIAYSVTNESYSTRDESEQIESGKRIPIYSKSNFIDYVSRATFARDEFPGPLQHIGVICEDHIIDVVSTAAPQIRRIWPE
jgi:hypothetical protein